MTAFLACAGPAAALAVAPPPPAPRVTAPGTPQHQALRLAQRLLRLGNVEGALVLLDRAVALDPDVGIAHLSRALCLAQLGREGEAHAALDRALACPETDGNFALQLASISARSGDAGLAMGLLEVAVAATPETAQRAFADPAFAGLRDHPRFLLIVGAL